MKINIEDVRQILTGLLDNTISKEAAANWAYNLTLKSDNNELVYSPMEHKDVLWRSILFIQGIDLMVAPNEYLHGKLDIEWFLNEIKHI